MSVSAAPPARLDDPRGIVFAASSYVLWGLVTIYWKLVGTVPTDEVLAHRVFWGMAVAIILVAATGRMRHVRHVLRRPRTLALLSLTAVLIAVNWYLFIWAVQQGRVLETSLGYYINPLMNIVLGVVLLGEKLTSLRRIAVAIAAIAVIIQVVILGELPWVSLVLAGSFGFYGYLRKIAPVESLEGLFIETLVLLPLALIWLVTLELDHGLAFFEHGPVIVLLLIGAGPVTAIPLLLFAAGIRRIRLSTLGFLQYIAPTISFLLAVFVWHEPFGPVHAATFALIWFALALVTWDAFAAERRLRASRAVPMPD